MIPQDIGDRELDCIEIPRDVPLFSMPKLPDAADARDMAQARDCIAGLLATMAAWRTEEAHRPCIDLTGLAAGPLAIVNEVLGEGEMSVRIAGPNPIRIQETVFAGVWRVCHFDADGRVLRDRAEACALPAEVTQAAARSAATIEPQPASNGTMNAPALLHEIREQAKAWRAGDPAHVVNLTLMPLTLDDHVCLQRALPAGPVAMVSRGFGNCRIGNTASRHVWRVQYFNSAETLILDTIEVVDVPEVALAAPEDIADSRDRLAELLDWMNKSGAD